MDYAANPPEPHGVDGFLIVNTNSTNYNANKTCLEWGH
jgi:hypothetical protein